MKVTVFVGPKKNILDPQGAAVKAAMEQMGFPPEGAVRMGKTIAFELKAKDEDAVRALLEPLCKQLLANPVIEDYNYTLEP